VTLFQCAILINLKKNKPTYVQRTTPGYMHSSCLSCFGFSLPYKKDFSCRPLFVAYCLRLPV